MISRENVESMISYSVGMFSMVVASLPQVADVAQHVAVILGCGVVAIRLIYDGVRLNRLLKNPRKGE